MTSSSNLLTKGDCIHHLSLAGYTLTKLVGKAPTQTNWGHTEYDPLVTASDFPDNYGVVLRSDDFVIDVDPRNFPPEVDSFQLLLTYLQMDAFNTFIVKTGGGGLHIYLKKPPGIVVRGKHVKFPGIDFKTRGTQVVGPGSTHPETGAKYIVAKGTPYEVADCPVLLLELLQIMDVQRRDGVDIVLNSQAAVSRFRELLLRTDGAVEGQNGDSTTYKLAQRGFDCGLDETYVYELMAAHWNPKCSPPWSDFDLRTKVENAGRYRRSRIGSGTAQADFEDELASPDAQRTEEYADHQRLAFAQVPYPWVLTHRTDANGNQLLKNTALRNVTNVFEIPDYKSYTNPLFKMLKFNEMTGIVEKKFPAPWDTETGFHPNWTDTDSAYFKMYLNENFALYPGDTLILQAVGLAAQEQTYHPVRDYLNALVWDGVPRVERLFTHYAGAIDNPYTRAIARKLMAAAVAKVLHVHDPRKPSAEKGVKFDHMIIMEGDQGIGKSTFCKILGGAWYADIQFDLRNFKDTVAAYRSNWFIECSEFASFGKQDIAALKAFMTQQFDVLRLPYDRTPSEIIRRYVSVATYNPQGSGRYLLDPTGNRRFWPLECTRFRNDELAEDRDQLWAEAKVLLARGEKLYLDDPIAAALALKAQNRRTVVDVWHDRVEDWINQERSYRQFPRLYTVSVVATQALNMQIGRLSQVDRTRIENILNQMGGIYGRHRTERGLVLGFMFHPRSIARGDDVND